MIALAVVALFVAGVWALWGDDLARVAREVAGERAPIGTVHSQPSLISVGRR